MKILRLLLAFLLWSAVTVHAEEYDLSQPDGIVKKTVNEVLAILTTDKDLVHDPKKRENLVYTLILPRFDFSTMTKLTVGDAQWGVATPQEQSELTDEYRAFLTNIFSKSLNQYSDEKVSFLSTSLTTENDAVVKYKVIDPTDPPALVDIKMIKAETGWLAYDIVWDGVSLIRTYKSNFKSLLQVGGVPNLTSALRKKNQEIKAANSVN